MSDSVSGWKPARVSRARGMLLASCLIVLSVLAAACDKEDSRALSQESAQSSETPDQIIDSFDLTITDSGVRKGWVTALEAEKYVSRKLYTARELKVVFYNPAGQVNSVLTSRRGIIHIENGDMEAMDSVVVFSADSSRVLLTERLLWRKSDNRILSDTTVEVRSLKGVVFGDGMESDASFTDVQVKNPTGDINALRQ